MIIQISVGIVSLAFVALVIYLIAVLVSVRKTLDESNQLVRDVDDLIIDIKSKVDTVDNIFNVFSQGEEKVKNEEKGFEKDPYHTLAKVFEGIACGIVLFNKFRGGKKHHGKSK